VSGVPEWLRGALGGAERLPGTEMAAWLELAARIDEVQAERDEFDEAHRADRERARRAYEETRARAGIAARDGLPVAAGGRTVFGPRPAIRIGAPLT
jgi:hypothetical protein